MSCWWALVNFLQDDEANIRDNATKTVIKLITLLGDPDFPLSLFAEKTPIHLAVCLFAHICEPALALPSFVSWMLASHAPPVDVENDEQPFEKGELNTFAEEVSLTDMCGDLLSYVAKKLDSQATFASTAFFGLVFDEEPTEPVALSLDDLYQYCVRNIQRDATEAFSSKTALLLNRHADAILIRVYQNVRVASSLKSYVSPECIAKCLPALSGVKKALKKCGGRTVFINKMVKHLQSLLQSGGN